MANYFICGGAGFLGSSLVADLIGNDEHKAIIYDDFSTGSHWHLRESIKDRNASIIPGDLRDLNKLVRSMKGSDIVYHLASHPDLTRAGPSLAVDFGEDTFITQNILEAMRLTGVKRILYGSGDSVYGDPGEEPVQEGYGPLRPVSLSGASKLACEALISSYCHNYNLHGAAFRFACVVGPNMKQGVIRELISKLQNHDYLTIPEYGGRGQAYLYVNDAISAMRTVEKQLLVFDQYNVAALDTVSAREIAFMAAGAMGLKEVEYGYSIGHKLDAPVVRLDTQRIRGLGWRNKFTSRQAVQKTIESIIDGSSLHFHYYPDSVGRSGN